MRQVMTLPSIEFKELPQETGLLLESLAKYAASKNLTTNDAISDLAHSFTVQVTYARGGQPTFDQLEQYVRAMLTVSLMWGVDTGRVELED